MPHPSIPGDDFRAHSFNREHGPARAGSRGRLVADVCVRKSHSEVDQRVERLSDGIRIRCLYLRSLYLCMFIVGVVQIHFFLSLFLYHRLNRSFRGLSNTFDSHMCAQ
ncbi:hypothetical protein C8R44DRAFT_238581 [Mycena epipterygia]|nr:hypothetical protein C8R44DRAFT_238581 [Mycena epipterygia]